MHCTGSIDAGTVDVVCRATYLEPVQFFVILALLIIGGLLFAISLK